MGFMKKEEVNGNSPYKDLKIGDQDNGYTFGILYLTNDSAVSPEYGKFDINQGVGFNPEAQSEEELLSSMELVSYIPNTMLKSFEKNGAFAHGVAYILTKKWTKGDKYDGNKRAKGHGFTVEKVTLPTSTIDKMTAWHNEAMSVVTKTEVSSSEQSEPTQTNKVKI